MGKAEAGTPRDISNRMKLKGLQKLKFYCQMCKKQCRDQNGFTCHLKSETHVQNMRQFAENPTDFISQYSRDFENGFMDILQSRFHSKRVLANAVYKDFIGDKTHVHMNSTRWSTLTGFVMHLRDAGKIEVDNSGSALYITYIDRGFDTMKQQREEERKMRVEFKEEQARQFELERELAHAQKLQSTMQLTQLSRNDQLEDIDIGGTFTLDFKEKKEQQKDVFKFDFATAAVPVKVPEQPSTSSKVNTAIEEEEEEEEDVAWVQAGILVKLKDKELLGGIYYNKKAVVKSIDENDSYSARVELLETTPVVSLQIDQQFLETVIPKIGGEVMLLHPGHAHHKELGILTAVRSEEFEGVIEIKKGSETITVNEPYEYFSKTSGAK